MKPEIISPSGYTITIAIKPNRHIVDSRPYDILNRVRCIHSRTERNSQFVIALRLPTETGARDGSIVVAVSTRTDAEVVHTRRQRLMHQRVLAEVIIILRNQLNTTACQYHRILRQYVIANLSTYYSLSETDTDQ